MHLIWKTVEAEGEYWAFIHVEGLCNFRPVHVDDWPSVLRPLQEHFNIELWVLYEFLPHLLTIQVVWEVIISELFWKGLKTRMCINIFSILEMGQRNKKRQGIIVSTILYWIDVFFIVQTKILLFFVANLFILTIFLSFLIWLIFMDNSFPHLQNGSNSGSKPLTVGPTCARPNC